MDRDLESNIKQFLKNSALASIGQLSYDAPIVSDADIEDAMAFEGGEEESQFPMLQEDLMDEDHELDEMIASYEQQQQPQNYQSEPHMSDDEYDDIFTELLAKEQSQSQQQIPSQMDTDDDVGMSF